MPGGDQFVLNEFLHRFLADQERGAVQDVGAYQTLFPGSEAAIAAEYAALTSCGARPCDPAPVEAPLERIGPYVLRDRIGQGSFGLVYRAEDTRLGRIVALKVLAHAGLETAAERERFEREAVIASRLDHPGICAIHEVARHAPWTCIAMRFVPGETLAARLLREGGALHDWREAVAIVEQVARALHAAHAAGVVHRDVKPGNVMLPPDGVPVVVDFGLARDTRGDLASWAAVAEQIGTPSYMAPEQIDAARGASDARADVWALGVTAYECLAGARPFEAPTREGLFDAVLRREPLPLRRRAPRLPRDLEVVVATAMAKAPARRYATAAAFADDLARVLRGEPVAARPIGPLARLLRWTRRNPVVAALAAAVLLVLALGLAVAGALWLRAERSLDDWGRLVDARRLERLQREADDELWPAVGAEAPAMARWLDEARALVARRADHVAALRRLRARARPWGGTTEALERAHDAELQRLRDAIDARAERVRACCEELGREPQSSPRVAAMRAFLQAAIARCAADSAALRSMIEARDCYEFDDPGDQIQHDQIADVVHALDRLEGAPGPATTTLAAMQERLARATTLRRRSIDAHADEWRAAAVRVRSNPACAALALEPQEGLVPLGPDPTSHLEEFAALDTGDVPARDADGRLAVTPATAVVFVLLPPGRFPMGAQAGDPTAPGYDPLAQQDEAPVRTLTTGAFLLSKYELTQGQCLRMSGSNPSYYSLGNRDGDRLVDLDHPVEQLSYRDATSLLRHFGWWLPSEAGWEYACRAGTTTPWPDGEGSLGRTANLADRAFHAAFPTLPAFDERDDGRALHAPVGSFAPNAFGLHDMIGNVAEWCYEQYLPFDAARTTAAAAPPVARIDVHVLRGGSWYTTSRDARASARRSYEATTRTIDVGVRPMRALEVR